jgi:hypothetical protein
LVTRHCDALILTATTSTFGWWMGWLQRPGSPVFYRKSVVVNTIRNWDYFPPAWTPLALQPMHQVVVSAEESAVY